MSRKIIGREKRYVEVDVRFEQDGHLRPLAIRFGPEQVYKIEKIKDVSRRAAEVGGVGDRYICVIHGRETNLWMEKGRCSFAKKMRNGFTKNENLTNEKRESPVTK